MTKVVAIASPKGGTGKSMLTALLGSEAAAVGKKVLMIDADPQQTLTLWKAQCEVNDIPLTNMEFAHIADPNALAARLRQTTDNDLVIVDNQGAANERMTVAAQNSDLVLIPSRPIVTELVEAAKLVDLLNAFSGRGPKTPIRVILNAVETFDRNTSSGRTAYAYIVSKKLPMLECVVSSRLYYKNMISGYTLETLPGDKKAITAARWSIIDVLEELQVLLGISLVPASVE